MAAFGTCASTTSIASTFCHRAHHADPICPAMRMGRPKPNAAVRRNFLLARSVVTVGLLNARGSMAIFLAV
jgi:hypothetical protein